MPCTHFWSCVTHKVSGFQTKADQDHSCFICPHHSGWMKTE